MQQFRTLLRGWVGKLLLVIFILPFAFFGIQGILLNSGKSSYVLKVNGTEITKAEVDRAINSQRNAMIERLGGKVDPSLFTDDMLRPRVLQMLIQKQLLTQAVHDEGLYVSTEALKEYVRNMPQFKDETGSFSQQKLETILARANYTMPRFLKELREGMVSQQLQEGISSSAFITQPELKSLIQLDGQKRDVAYATVKMDSFKDQVKVTDDELKKYYDNHKDQYRTPEKVQIRYLEFKASDFSQDVQVSDDDVLADYDSYVKSVQGQEKRQASHILVEVNKKRDDADAKARIEEVQKKLEAGEDFASLAKEYSDDIASAKSGGDLGYAGRGIYDPAFEKALFDLKKVGDVSGIVKTQFGYHIIKLTGIEKPKVESFEDKKAALKAELIKSKAMDKLNDAIDDLNRLTYESGDLSAIAEKYHKKVQVSEPFTHQGGNGITANKKVIDAAFSEPVLKEGANSDAIQLEDGTVVVLRLEKHFPARTQTLDEVKSQVQEAVVDEKARDKARDVANEIVKKLDSGSTQDAVAAEYKVTWTKKEGVTRRSTDVSQGIVSKLFGMPKPGKSRFVVDTLAQPSGDEQVLVLSKIEPGEFKLTDDEKLKAELAGGNHLGQQDFDNYMATLKQNAEIERK